MLYCDQHFDFYSASCCFYLKFLRHDIIWHYFVFKTFICLLYNRAWVCKNTGRKGASKFAKTCFFFRVSRSILSFLHTFIRWTLSVCCSVFLVLFSQCHATIHPQSAFVPNNTSPLHSFCLQDNQMSVSYSGAMPPRYIVLTRSLSLPPSAPCYLWKTKLPEYREVAWRCTLPPAKWCNHCQEFDRTPSVTSTTPPPHLSTPHSD